MIALWLAAGTMFAADRLPVSTQTVCKDQPIVQTSAAEPALLLRPQDRAAVGLRRLGDLPKANKEVAVLRVVGGCVLPVGVSYGVEGDGRSARGSR